MIDWIVTMNEACVLAFPSLEHNEVKELIRETSSETTKSTPQDIKKETMRASMKKKRSFRCGGLRSVSRYD